jgi:rubrerythrin
VALPGGKFDPRTVALGPEAEHGMVEVISGLNEGERVVTSGQFMLDSESQLREAIQKMRGPASLGETTGEPNATNAPTEDGSRGRSPHQAETSPLVYVCPMPEHTSIIYDHPGHCPICGMALVPVTPHELAQLQPGGKVLYYTCPMPEHNYIHEDKPGKCPICGMTLIPVMAPPDAIQQSTNPPIQNPAPSNTNAASETKPAAKQLYTCPMHPDVISDQPGKCPKCGMDLVPLEK